MQAQDYAVARTQRQQPTWDIQPAEENMALRVLRSRYPNLEQRFGMTEINDLLRDQVMILRSQGIGRMAPQPVQVGPAASQPRPVYVDPSQVIRRQTYIETAPPTATTEPTPPMRLDQAFMAELKTLEVKKGSRLSAPEYKDLLIRHGVAQVNDFGEQVLTR